MNCDIEKIKNMIFDSIDAVFYIDADADSFVVVKADDGLRKHFGSEGSHHELMKIFLSSTMNSVLAEDSAYKVFFDDASGFVGRIAKKVKLKINGKETTVQVNNIPLENNQSIVLVNYVDEDAYLSESRGDAKVKAMKSAFLFSMMCDLKNDKCSNMDMSELDDNPVNSLRIPYTQWRSTIVNMIWPDEQQKFLDFTDPQYLMSVLEYHHPKSTEFQMMNLEQKFIWVNLIFSRLNTGNDEDFQVVFVVEDVHEAYESFEKDVVGKLESQVKEDSLTGLLNHGHTESFLKESISGLETEKVSLIMLDIDHFKHVNDTYGHAAGDAVLKEFSATAGEFIEKLGTKSKDEKSGREKFSCQLGRWGGEEFLGICRNKSLDELAEKAEELRKIIENKEFPEVGHITSSFGVIEIKDGESAEEAFERVDKALYAAKQGGRNRVVRG